MTEAHGLARSDAPDAASWRPATAVTSISRLAEMTGTTPRALRHYQQEGLLDPARGASGQRRYGPRDVDRALTIVWLRTLDISIPDIRDLLDDLKPAEARTRLRRQLRRRIADLEHARRTADQALAVLDRGPAEDFDLRALRASSLSSVFTGPAAGTSPPLASGPRLQIVPASPAAD